MTRAGTAWDAIVGPDNGSDDTRGDGTRRYPIHHTIRSPRVVHTACGSLHPTVGWRNVGWLRRIPIADRPVARAVTPGLCDVHPASGFKQHLSSSAGSLTVVGSRGGVAIAGLGLHAEQGAQMLGRILVRLSK